MKIHQEDAEINHADAETSIRPSSDQVNVETARGPGTIAQTSLPQFGLAGDQRDPNRTVSSYGPPQILRDLPPLKGAVPSVEGYEMVQLLGKGGEGEVWKATRTATGQEVALKIFNREDYFGSDVEFNQQRALSEHLSHFLASRGSSVVTIGGSGHARDERPYIVMNLMDHHRGWEAMIQHTFKFDGPGTTPKLQVSLSEYISHFEEATRTAWHLAGEINVMHELGLYHGDIKPENLTFGKGTSTIAVRENGTDFDGKPFNRHETERLKNAEGEKEFRDHRDAKVLDMGIMRRWREEADNAHRMPDDFRKFHATIPMVEREATKRVIGTPAYTSPECYEGQAGPWSDQRAYGLAMYKLFTGINPGARDSEGNYPVAPPLMDALPEEFKRKLKDPNFTLLGMPAASVVYMLSETIDQSIHLEYSKRHKDMGQMADLLSECVAQDEAVWATFPQAVRDMLRRSVQKQKAEYDQVTKESSAELNEASSNIQTPKEILQQAMREQLNVEKRAA